MNEAKADDPVIAFWDSSAIIPLCVHEPATAHARSLADSFSTVVWWGTPTEVHSAIARRVREGMPQSDVNRSIARFDSMRQTWLYVLPDPVLREEAQRLLYLYPLRAADSLQLAAAMIWCRNRPAGRTFLCADTRLAEAAIHAGFTVLRP